MIYITKKDIRDDFYKEKIIEILEDMNKAYKEGKSASEINQTSDFMCYKNFFKYNTKAREELAELCGSHHCDYCAKYVAKHIKVRIKIGNLDFEERTNQDD